MGDFDVCNKKKQWISPLKEPKHLNKHVKLLMNYSFGEASFEYFESCNFSRENTNIDVFVFMFDLMMINMSSECEYDWYWKISKYTIKSYLLY